MIYHNKNLYIYWRENFTERTTFAGDFRATYCKVFTEEDTKDVAEPILKEQSKFCDKEMCPTFFIDNDNFYCYGVDFRFTVEKWKHKKILNKIFRITGGLGIYSQARSNGIALWQGESLDNPFRYLETMPIQQVNKLHKPWHMDFFTFREKMYAVILTNESLGDVCLAESADGRNYRMLKKTLLTNKTLRCIEIYKPSALVVEGTFYLYYTARNSDNPSLNKLYLAYCPFIELIKRLDR